MLLAAMCCVSGTAENDELKNLAGAIANKLLICDTPNNIPEIVTASVSIDVFNVV